MRSLIFAAFLCLASMTFAATWHSVDIVDGEPVVTTYRSANAPKRLKANEYPGNTVFPSVEPRYWKKQGKNWVEMNAQEKASVDADLKDDAVDTDDDPRLEALISVVADLHGLTAAQVKSQMKAKLTAEKARKAKRKRSR